MLMDTITKLDSAGTTTNVSGDAVEGAVYDLAGSTLNQPTDDAAIFRFSCTRNFKLLAGLTGSTSEGQVVPTGSPSYPIKKNGSTIGSIDFTAATVAATFTFSTETSFVQGDVIEIVAPATADATHDELSWTLAGQLT